MQEEAAEELFQRQSHQALLVLVRRVAPTKRDLSLLECDQSVIGNGHAMRVAAQIAECVFGSAERALANCHITSSGPIRPHQAAMNVIS